MGTRKAAQLTKDIWADYETEPMLVCSNDCSAYAKLVQQSGALRLWESPVYVPDGMGTVAIRP